ncbi:MAG: hypothetical protein ACI849_001420 [Patiriisocius sp.]|jgi:hypothetical protein
MKKSILIFSTALVILSLMSCGKLSGNDLETYQVDPLIGKEMASNRPAIGLNKNKIFTDFIYDVGPRFGPIKKGAIDKATTIDAFFDEDETQNIVSLTSVTVIIVIDDKRSDIRETGYSSDLTTAQLKLLQSSDYNTNFLIKAEYQQLNTNNNKLEPSSSTPHLTIVPEKQAAYLPGKDVLKEYLKTNSEGARETVDPKKLKPAKLFFTVTKNGTLEHMRLDRPSGYPHIDKKMIEFINKAPGAWIPAENIKGEKVDQELVVSFGLMGC